MDDDPNPPPANYPLLGSNAKMSRTPSWVMLGFVLGALFVYALMRHEDRPPPPTVTVRVVDPPKAAARREAAALTTIEAVFAVWGEHATWSGDRTEVALWNQQERKFSDYYEVRRIGGILYFRSLPELTRRIIRHGRELPDSPLQYTETEEQYREWLEHGRKERPAEAPAPPRIISEVPPLPVLRESVPIVTPLLPPSPRAVSQLQEAAASPAPVIKK